MVKGLRRSSLRRLALAAWALSATAAMAQASAEEAVAQEANAAIESIPVETLEPETEVAPLEPEAATLDNIVVTGSRISRADYETANPVLRITRQDIERTGMTSIGDLLQNLPQAGSALNTAFNNGGNGSVEIDLRNLGSNRVLVLVNGRRWVGGLSAFSTNSVDLNTIPISIIDSIEVLKDGASAVYGSDAIAGVVNIKTRRDFQGGELRAHGQVYDDGSALTQSYSYAVGASNGTSSAFLDLSYTNQGELLAKDRELSSVPTFGTGITRGSAFTPEGRILFVPTPTNGNVISMFDTSPTGACPDLSGAVVDGTLEGEGLPGTGATIPAGSPLTLCDLARRPGAGTDPSGNYARWDQNVDPFNYALTNYLLTPSERIGIFGQIGHDFDNGIRFTSEALFNQRNSAQQLAQTPLGVGDALPAPFSLAYVDATNPFNPTNPNSPYYIPGTTPQDIGRADAAAGLVGLGAVLRRMVELGPRHFEQQVDTLRIGGGFDGQFEVLSLLASWDVSAAYSQSSLATTESGLVNMARVARAVGPEADCTGASDGCVPLDLFGGPGTITPEMLGYIAYTGHDTARQSQRLFNANLSTRVPVGNWLPDSIGIATGVELRTEAFESSPDPLKVAGISSTNAATATQGSYDALEVYVELGVPVVEDLPFMQRVDLSLAGRYSDYGDFGNNLSSKLGLEWRVIDGLLARATLSDAFRAPSITELFLGESVSFPEVQDPCASAERTDDPNVAANCDADGAATTQTNSQLPVVFGGNPDLEPETATTLTAGLVWSPEFIADFSVSVDWYRIELVDAISFTSADQIFELCYRADPDSRALCDRVMRTPDGQIASVQATAVNLSSLNVEGVDMNVDWKLNYDWLQPFGEFRVVFDGAYVTRYAIAVPTADGEAQTGLVGQEFGGQGAVPRFKFNTGLIYANGPWSASWTARFIYKLTETCDDGFQDPGAANGGSNPTPVLSLDEFGLCSGQDRNGDPINELATTVYHDVQGGFEMTQWNTQLVIGVINLFDQDPPPAYSAFANSYDPTQYDVPGSRTPYLRLISQF